MSLNLDIGVVRAIGAVIVLLGIGGWWYLVTKTKENKPEE